jgi:hypothetical protein
MISYHLIELMKKIVWCQIQLGDLLRTEAVAKEFEVFHLHLRFLAFANNLIKATTGSFD